MKDFDFSNPKTFDFHSVTTTTNIPRGRFKRSNGFYVWLKAEEVRNVVQVNNTFFHVYFIHSRTQPHQDYVEIESTPEAIDKFWGMGGEEPGAI